MRTFSISNFTKLFSAFLCVVVLLGKYTGFMLYYSLKSKQKDEEIAREEIPKVKFCTLFFSTRSRNSFCWHRERRNCKEASHCWLRKWDIFMAHGNFDLSDTISLDSSVSFCRKSLVFS